MKKIVIIFSVLLLVSSTLGAQVRPKKPRDLESDIKSASFFARRIR